MTGDRVATGRDREALRIRPYAPGDRAPVIALWEAVFPDDPPHNEPGAVIDRKQTVQPELFLVAADGGDVVGTVLAGFDGVRGWVHHLAVDPLWRRRGVGASLMDAAERGLARAGCPKLNLQVRATNRGVLAFYEGLGYAVEDRVSMGKHLSGRGSPRR